jgi:hypothetical protein
MRRSRLPLSGLYPLVQAYLKDHPPTRPRPRGRPPTYSDAWVLTLWFYQTLWRTSYRETLAMARREGFPTPALGAYHYRRRRLPLSLFPALLTRVGQVLRQRDPEARQVLWVDGTGFGFQDRYAL